MLREVIALDPTETYASISLYTLWTAPLILKGQCVELSVWKNLYRMKELSNMPKLKTSYEEGTSTSIMECKGCIELVLVSCTRLHFTHSKCSASNCYEFLVFISCLSCGNKEAGELISIK